MSGGLQGFPTNSRRKDTPHPLHKPYAPECIKLGCNEKPYYNGEIYFSLCLSCLQNEKLGPFKPRFIKEHYSSLFWLTDFERKHQTI